MYIRSRKQRTFCVASSIAMKSQAASWTALVNYSKILLLTYTAIDRFEKYIYHNKKKNLSILEFIREKSLRFVLPLRLL
jgi:hypothetical protein